MDLSDRLSGAWAARLFGDFGADVVLVEPPEGHPLRDEPPFLDGLAGLDGLDGETAGDGAKERSLLHAYANWNKRSVVAGRDADLARLCAGADVVVTTGASPPEVPPGAVHLSLTPHGLTGPLAGMPGNNLTTCARVGWATINKREDEPPLQLPNRQTGYIAGVAGFIAAAAALYRGGGERIDVSETEAVALTCAPWAVMGIFVGGEAAAFGPNGRRRRGRPGPLWKTADGFINYGYGDWQQWTSAMRFLGLDDLAEDERFVSAWGRHQQDTRPVRAGLAEASATRNKWELFHGLAKRRCISGVVQNMSDLHGSAQLRARGFLVEAQAGGRATRATGAPAKLSETPWRLRRPAPALGEHNGLVETKPPPTASPPRRTTPRRRARAVFLGRHLLHRAARLAGSGRGASRNRAPARRVARRRRPGAAGGVQRGHPAAGHQHQRHVQLGELEQARGDAGRHPPARQGDVLAAPPTASPPSSRRTTPRRRARAVFQSALRAGASSGASAPKPVAVRPARRFCTELLALLGADVVQVETVRRPDVWRGAGAPVPPAGSCRKAKGRTAARRARGRRRSRCSERAAQAAGPPRRSAAIDTRTSGSRASTPTACTTR